MPGRRRANDRGSQFAFSTARDSQEQASVSERTPERRTVHDTKPRQSVRSDGATGYTDGVGFEPTVRYERTHTFQACALNHSATRPCYAWEHICPALPIRHSPAAKGKKRALVGSADAWRPRILSPHRTEIKMSPVHPAFPALPPHCHASGLADICLPAPLYLLHCNK